MKKSLFFLLATFIYSFAFSQNAYTFNGSGNWSDSANWLNRKIPPLVPAAGAVITINPSGECLLNVPVRIPANINLIIQPGKKLLVAGGLFVHYDSTVVLKDNVHVIDTTVAVLNSTESMLESGIYKYSFNSVPTGFITGDVLIGPSGNGYIRKINSLSAADNTITFQTIQGSMEDVFKQGAFNFSLNTDNLAGRSSSTTANGYSYLFNNITLYQNGTLKIELNNGNISLDPNWNFDFDFQNLKLKNFKVACENANLTGAFDVTVTSAQAVNLLDRVDTLKRLKKRYTKWVPVYGIPVPVVVEMNLDFICKYAATINANVSRTTSFSSNNAMSLGVNYNNGSWTPLYNLNSVNNVSIGATSGNVNAVINVAIVPTFSFKLYGLAGPYISMGLHEQLNAGIASPALDWDFSAGTWVKTTVGANARPFGNSLFDFSKAWDTDTFFYKTPYNITKVSGDNQYGTASQFLTQPIKIRVLDKLNSPQSNVPVYFSVTTGGGILQDASALTDNSGYAQTLWKLGSQLGIQHVEATVKKGDGSLVSNAPVEFSGNVFSDSTFTDPRDGQVYKTKRIGSQVWMTQNLNYAAAGSWCYDENSSNCATYGRLYDWTTVLTAAPPGWHLPSDAEWTTLTDFLGGEALAGGTMKSTTGWNPPNTGATNSSGFSALPGGYRWYGGNTFSYAGTNGYWWTSTLSGTSTAWVRYLNYNNVTVIKSSGYTVLPNGFSVRCVKD